jgi:hypothetical protein
MEFDRNPLDDDIHRTIACKWSRYGSLRGSKVLRHAGVKAEE